MYVITGKVSKFESDATMKIFDVPQCDEAIGPILYSVPLQLPSYHVAVTKGMDVDQPRNLAKSEAV
ncbi:MAG: hypothetical protein MK096_07135 [Oleiphilaceae bacterium]|nr:hypothetical protein [Oleiphilaceae bacterium]